MSNSQSHTRHPLTGCYDSILAVRLFLCNRVAGEQAPFESAQASLASTERKLRYAFEAYLQRILPSQSSFYLHNVIAQVNYQIMLNYFKAHPNSVHIPALLPSYKGQVFARRKDIFDQYLALLTAMKSVYGGGIFWERDLSASSIDDFRAFERSAQFHNHRRSVEPQFPRGLSRTLQVFRSRILAEAFLQYPHISNEQHALRLRQAQYNVDKYTCQHVTSDPNALGDYLRKLDVVLNSFANRKVSKTVYDARTQAIRGIISTVSALSGGMLTVRVTGLLAMTIDQDTTPLQLMIVAKDAKKCTGAVFDKAVASTIAQLRSSRDLAGMTVDSVKSNDRVIYGVSEQSLAVQIYTFDADMFSKVGLYNNYAQCTPVLGQLCRAILSWASRRSLIDNNDQGMTSYTLVLMIIQYLQLQDILPVLQKSSGLYSTGNTNSNNQEEKPTVTTTTGTSSSSWSNLFKKSVVSHPPVAPATSTSACIAKQAVITPIKSIPEDLPKWVKGINVYKELAIKTFKTQRTNSKHNRRISSTTVFTDNARDILTESQLHRDDWNEIVKQDQGQVLTLPGLKIGICPVPTCATDDERRKCEAPVKKACYTSLSSLFIGFFMFYTYTFNRELMAISVRAGHLLWAEQARHLCTKSLCIEDPVSPLKYVTQAVSEDAIEGFFLEFKRMCMLLINQIEVKELTSSYLSSLHILQYISENRPSDVGYDSFEHSSICNWFVVQDDVDEIKKVSLRNASKQKVQHRTVEKHDISSVATMNSELMQKRMEKKKLLREKREGKKLLIAACIRERELRYEELLASIVLASEEKTQQLQALELENQQDKMLLLSYDADDDDDADDDSNVLNISHSSAMDDILATPMIYFHNDSDFEEEEEEETVKFATFEEMEAYSDEDGEGVDSLHLLTVSPRKIHMPSKDDFQNVQDIVQSLNKALVDVQDDEEDDENMYLSFA